MPELHTIETEDGCLLDAAYWPAASVPEPPRADACVFTHGATGHAFAPFQRAFGEALSAAGIATLSINTRGHDIVSRLVHREGLPTRCGTAFEDLDEAWLDLHAGAAFLRARGAARIVIGGHSLGAVKSIYVQATRPVPGALCVLAISPPRIAFDVQEAEPFGKPFRKVRTRALKEIAAQRPATLLDAPVPIPSLFGAAQYEKKYGPENRYDIARHLGALRVPAFVLYGSAELEQMPQMRASEAVVADWTRVLQAPGRCAIVPGADHSYTGMVEQATAQAIRWLR